MFNVANIARLGRSAISGFALIVLLASLAQATYGPRTTIGNSYQQTSTTQSKTGIGPESCNGAGSCIVLFHLVPPQKTLIIQHVSCFFIVSTGSPQNVTLLTYKGQGTFPLRHTFLPPVLTPGGRYIANGPVMHLVESGERPIIAISNSIGTNWTVTCSISGTLS